MYVYQGLQYQLETCSNRRKTLTKQLANAPQQFSELPD